MINSKIVPIQIRCWNTEKKLNTALGRQTEPLSFDCLHHTAAVVFYLPGIWFVRDVTEHNYMTDTKGSRDRGDLCVSAQNNIHKLSKTAMAIEPEESHQLCEVTGAHSSMPAGYRVISVQTNQTHRHRWVQQKWMQAHREWMFHKEARSADLLYSVLKKKTKTSQYRAR